MRAILRNNLRRLWTQKQLIVLLVVFTTVATAAAIFVSTGLEQIWNVAVVSSQPEGMEADNVNFIEVEQIPSRADLVSGRFDAILIINADDSYELDSIKSDETTSRLIAALEGKQDSTALFSDRGTGTNVLGFLMMFILLMGSTAMYMYADDKEQNHIIRVAASPVGIGTYQFAHCLFNFCFLYFPIMLILFIVRWISGVTLNYSFLELAGLIAVLCAFSTTFCLLLYSLLSNRAEAAKMTGNTIIILTSILAGSFYAFDKGNHALELLITVLPQKAYLTLADKLEQGAAFMDYLPSLAYLLVLIVAFYAISVIKTRRAYVNKH